MKPTPKHIQKWLEGKKEGSLGFGFYCGLLMGPE